MEALFETEFDELLGEDEWEDAEWEELLNEILNEVDFGEPQGEVTSNNRQRVRWIQQSLNKILRMRLKVDGIMGPKTRSAIRIFQRKYRLRVDGIVGPRTEKALRSAGRLKPSSQSQQVIYPPDTITGAAARLKNFDFNSAALKPFHRTAINRITDKIIQSWRIGKPIFTVKVIGHTDLKGSHQYNQKLGLRRALAVRKELQNTLKRKQRDLYYKVLVLASSKGKTERIDFTNTPKGQAQNRRVELFLSTKALLPLPPPSTVPTPVANPPVNTPPSSKCDPGYLDRGLRECEKQLRDCIKKCKTDKNFIWNKIKDNVAIASCFGLGHPVAIAACALSLGGIYYKELIDEYFRLSSCEDGCKILLRYCKERAHSTARRLNAHCS